jgi:hypothetical protein
LVRGTDQVGSVFLHLLGQIGKPAVGVEEVGCQSVISAAQLGFPLGLQLFMSYRPALLCPVEGRQNFRHRRMA